MSSTNPITLTASYHCCLILTQCTASSPRNAQLSQLDLVSILFNWTPLKYSAAQLIKQFNNFNNYLVWSGLRSQISSSESRAKRQIQNLNQKSASHLNFNFKISTKPSFRISTKMFCFKSVPHQPSSPFDHNNANVHLNLKHPADMVFP